MVLLANGSDLAKAEDLTAAAEQFAGHPVAGLAELQRIEGQGFANPNAGLVPFYTGDYVYAANGETYFFDGGAWRIVAQSDPLAQANTVVPPQVVPPQQPVQQPGATGGGSGATATATVLSTSKVLRNFTRADFIKFWS